MPPLSAYFSRQMGAPMLSGEEEMAADAAAMMLGAWGQRGGGGGGGMFRRRGRGGGGQMTPGMARRVLYQMWGQHPQMLRGEDDLDGDEDEFGYDEDVGADAEELDGDDTEIDGLEADDEEGIGADGNEELGATVHQLTNKIQRLNAKKMILEAKLASTPPHRWRRRKKLSRMIARINRIIGKKSAKKNAKTAILAAKMGVPAAALAAGAAGAAVYGLDRTRAAEVERATGRGAAYAAGGDVGRYGRSPRSGIEERVAFQDTTGSQVTLVSIPSGAGVRTASVVLTTPLIPYAEFAVQGLDVKMIAIQATAGAGAGFPASEMLIDVLAVSLVVGGDINLFYTPQDVAFGGQFVGGQLSNARTIAGLRANSYMERNNTAVLTLTVRQEITNTSTITVSLQAALVCDVGLDRAARRAV